MIKNNSYYKGYDLLNENNREYLKNLLNPYEYNIESNLKDKSKKIITTNCKKHKKN